MTRWNTLYIRSIAGPNGEYARYKSIPISELSMNGKCSGREDKDKDIDEGNGKGKGKGKGKRKSKGNDDHTRENGCIDQDDEYLSAPATLCSKIEDTEKAPFLGEVRVGTGTGAGRAKFHSFGTSKSVAATENARLMDVEYKNQNVRTILELDSICSNMYFNTNTLLTNALAAALYLHNTGKICKTILSMVDSSCDFPNSVYIGDANCTNRLYKIMYSLPCRVKYRSSYVFIVNMMLRMTLKHGLSNNDRILKHMNPKYINRETLGMSPALYATLTLQRLDHGALIKTFSRYGNAECDIYMAAAHLMRGMTKYNCQFLGTTPNRMYFQDPTVIGIGCLRVLRNKLPKSEFMIALLAISVRFSCVEMATRRNVEMIDSVCQLLYKVETYLKRGATGTIFSDIYNSLVGSERITCRSASTQALMVKYITQSRVISARFGMVSRGFEHSCIVSRGTLIRLLLYARASRLSGYALHDLLHSYWSMVMYDNIRYYSCTHSSE